MTPNDAEMTDIEIDVKEALYGEGADWVDVTGEVAAALREQCFVAPSNALRGDPAPGRSKALVARCSVQGVDAPPGVAPEGSILVPSQLLAGVPTAAPGFSIASARWGAWYWWVDATEAVRRKVPDPFRELSFDLGDAGAYDPCLGFLKTLVVAFRHDGRFYVRCFPQYK